MKSRRLTKRLHCEALEGRLMLSVVPGLPTSAVVPVGGHNQPAAQVAKNSVQVAPISNVSSNWSGYAVTASANSVSNVAGTWTVPSVSTKTNGYSSIWVGIDGYSSSTVEQIGTDSDVVNGKATYYAWYEMYPSASMTINSMTVKPGDSITGSVSYDATGKDFVLTIADTTESETFTKTLAVKNAARSSAEWIVEAPSSGYGILPLANFGTATFTDAYATVNGTTGPIDSWQSYAINMASRSTTEASTSALTDSATATGMASGFTVTYNAPMRRDAAASVRRGRFGWRLGLGQMGLATAQRAICLQLEQYSVPVKCQE